MNVSTRQEGSLLSPAMLAVLLAQFLSSFADNALLFGAIALIRQMSGSDALAPWLQALFNIPYVILAALVGPYADSRSKGGVMLRANLIKMVSGLMILAALVLVGDASILVLAGYCVAGIGAAVYSPAKYGILTQMFGAERLVKANGLMEGSTIVAILLGSLLGAWLTDHFLTLTLWIVVISYGVAALMTRFIPVLPAEHPLPQFRPVELTRDFWRSCVVLWRDPWARTSLMGTSLFWGSGATLRLLLFAWVVLVLGREDTQTVGELLGAMSVGIVVGAALAGRFVTLQKVGRAFAGALLMGIPILLLSGTQHFGFAAVMMSLIGLAGGFFAIPFNAVLQERGHHSVGAGHAIAIQNFAENLMMGLMAGLYGLGRMVLGTTQIIAGFGVLILVFMGILFLLRPRQKAENTTVL